jgi:hypothetical protein
MPSFFDVTRSSTELSSLSSTIMISLGVLVCVLMDSRQASRSSARLYVGMTTEIVGFAADNCGSVTSILAQLQIIAVGLQIIVVELPIAVVEQLIIAV